MPMAHTSNVFKSNEDVEGKGHTEQDIGSNQVKGQKGRERKKKRGLCKPSFYSTRGYTSHFEIIWEASSHLIPIENTLHLHGVAQAS